MWYADVRDKMTIQPHETRCDIYKESARRFIPCGQAVTKEEIHLLSRIFLNTESFLQNLSMTIT